VERVDIPSWGIRRLRAKLDTGARSSALHVEHIEELEGARVRFEVVTSRARPEGRVVVEAPIVRRAKVKSSSGAVSHRLFVRVPVQLGEHCREVEVSLVGRSTMLFRMLLGRSALTPGLLVDPGARYVLSGGPRRIKRRAS